jgi:hypothetical protein
MNELNTINIPVSGVIAVDVSIVLQCEVVKIKSALSLGALI